MEGIDILIAEHEKVLIFTKIIKEKCLEYFKNDKLEIDVSFFENVIDFGRNFVDKHHHKKEENILFVSMKENLDEFVSHIIDDGMMFDHNTGRMFLMNIKYALTEYELNKKDEDKYRVISSAFNYALMMEDHISKENNVLYPYAKENFSSSDADKVTEDIKKYERIAKIKGVQESYLNLLNNLK